MFVEWGLIVYASHCSGKVRAFELRNNTKSELVNKLGDLKKELQTLRIAQVTGGASAKVSKIGEVRKNIARVLTVTNQITKSKVTLFSVLVLV